MHKKKSDWVYAAKVDIEDSQPFILDAKNYGNIARYIAHSCDPNLFSQKMIYINSQPIIVLHA